jgi:hypothetical protein
MTSLRLSIYLMIYVSIGETISRGVFIDQPVNIAASLSIYPSMHLPTSRLCVSTRNGYVYALKAI